MREYLKFYIDGQWVDPIEPAALDVDNSITALRTNGRTTTGDGGGAFYVRDTVASPGSIISTSAPSAALVQASARRGSHQIAMRASSPAEASSPSMAPRSATAPATNPTAATKARMRATTSASCYRL